MVIKTTLMCVAFASELILGQPNYIPDHYTLSHLAPATLCISYFSLSSTEHLER